MLRKKNKETEKKQKQRREYEQRAMQLTFHDPTHASHLRHAQESIPAVHPMIIAQPPVSTLTTYQPQPRLGTEG
jgi:hypothetical protein